MYYYRPDLAAPERLSVREADWCVRRDIRGGKAIRRAIRGRRIKALGDGVINGRRAAWALVVTPYQLRRFIKDERLQAEEVDDDGGRFHYAIPRDEIQVLAQELDAE